MLNVLKVYRKAPKALRQTHFFMYFVFVGALYFWQLAPTWPMLAILLVMVAVMICHYSQLKALVATMDKLEGLIDER